MGSEMCIRDSVNGGVVGVVACDHGPSSSCQRHRLSQPTAPSLILPSGGGGLSPRPCRSYTALGGVFHHGGRHSKQAGPAAPPGIGEKSGADHTEGCRPIDRASPPLRCLDFFVGGDHLNRLFCQVAPSSSVHRPPGLGTAPCATRPGLPRRPSWKRTRRPLGRDAGGT